MYAGKFYDIQIAHKSPFAGRSTETHRWFYVEKDINGRCLKTSEIRSNGVGVLGSLKQWLEEIWISFREIGTAIECVTPRKMGSV